MVKGSEVKNPRMVYLIPTGSIFNLFLLFFFGLGKGF